MKQAPHDKELLKRFLPSKSSGEGYLGNDTRGIDQIVADDAAILEKLGVDREKLADALTEAFDKARNSLTGEIEVRPGVIAEYHESRGKIPSPFRGEGAFEKGDVVLTAKGGDHVTITRLSIDLIRRHGFFQGHGSPFRVEPEVAARMMGMVS